MPSRIGGWDGMVQEPGLAREPLVEALKRELQDLEREELLWRVRTLDTPSAPHARVDGTTVLALSSTNSLALANHPRLKQTDTNSSRKNAPGYGSARGFAAKVS